MTGVFTTKKRLTKDEENFEKLLWAAKGTLLAIGVALVITFFGVPIESHAEAFPSDAHTVINFQSTDGQATVLTATTTRTILKVSIDVDGVNSHAELFCATIPNQQSGVNTILDTHASPAREDVGMVTHCDGQPLTTSFTGVGIKGGHVVVTYVDRDTNTLGDPMLTKNTGGFSYGEMVISFFLLLIFTLMFFQDVRNMVFKNGVVVKVIKEYDRKG